MAGQPREDRSRDWQTGIDDSDTDLQQAEHTVGVGGVRDILVVQQVNGVYSTSRYDDDAEKVSR